MNELKEHISQYLTWEEGSLKAFSSDSSIQLFEYEINEVKYQLKTHITSRVKILKGKQISNSTQVSHWVEVKKLA